MNSAADLITDIPGYGPPKVPMYAGTLPVDTATRAVKMFYIFTSILTNPSGTTPVILPCLTNGMSMPSFPISRHGFHHRPYGIIST